MIWKRNIDASAVERRNGQLPIPKFKVQGKNSTMDLAGKPELQILLRDLDIANVEERKERKSFVKWSVGTQTEEKNYTKPRSRQTL